MRVEVVPGERTSELRRSVLRPAWPPGTPMHGDDEPQALHIAALTDGGTLASACTRALAVDPEFQPAPVLADLIGNKLLTGFALSPPTSQLER